MRAAVAAAALLGSVVLALATPSQSQPAPGAPPAAPPVGTPPQLRQTDPSPVFSTAQLERSANSFTEGQTRSRLEDAGFTEIRNLTKDDDGLWRAWGLRNGTPVALAMDFRGRIAASPVVLPNTPPPASTPPYADAAPAPGSSPSR